MSSDSSSEATKVRAWLHHHKLARSSPWHWPSSGSSRAEHQPTSAVEIKSRLQNFVRRHSRHDLPPLVRSASQQTVPSDTATPEPPPPYSPRADIPPSPTTQAPLPSLPAADVLRSPPGINDDTPPPSYRNPVGPRPRRDMSDAIEASLGDDTYIHPSPPRRAHPRPIATFTTSELPRRYPGSLHGHSNSDDQFMGRHFRACGGPSTPRRKAVPQTLVYTPEYLRWKRGCEALQAESRAQREKNKMIEEKVMRRP